ncbi:hypothetical protein [Streptomyces sp. NBC_01483]|uniref:hypothetical protein n=1 Tax=Streptomyces sp. NBC_01483 TaxID=2903883 RepID=UPI002E34E447|nr:hypothetical protein [Streptomyces sp. NBC_01483]
MTATPPPRAPMQAAEFLSGQEITTTDCRRCGTQIAGINGRYSCSACGWVNDWSEGHTDLPTADDDTAA